MKKIDLAYMAGILDGEGCIYISKHKPKKRLNRSTVYCLGVTISMANAYIPKLFHFAFGGQCFFDKTRLKKHPDFQPLWTYRAYADNAINCLRVLLPYLHLKRDEANLAIQSHKKRLLPPNKKLTEEELAVREAQYLLMKSLKYKNEYPLTEKAEEVED